MQRVYVIHLYFGLSRSCIYRASSLLEGRVEKPPIYSSGDCSHSVSRAEEIVKSRRLTGIDGVRVGIHRLGLLLLR